VAVDSAGNLYVMDAYNYTIRKVSAAGAVTTLAGSVGVSGTNDGIGSAAQFNYSTSVAVDGAGNVYVADTSNNTIRKVTPAGVVTTLAGRAGGLSGYGSADGTGSAAQFAFPQGVAVDSAGNVYVADTQNNTIRKITPTGVVTTLAGMAGYEHQGSADGIGSAAQFNWPSGVAVDGAGNVYVADMRNNTIRKVTASGAVTTLAGRVGSSGGADGTGSAARFNNPAGLAVDSVGNVYVADNGNHAIRMVTQAGVVTTIGGNAEFVSPGGVAVDGAGNLYVADSTRRCITKGTPANPKLSISREGNNIVLSWFDPSGAWMLERKTGNEWGASPAIVPNEGAGIFRLRRVSP
jgi:sugar lactone lactonase YvrE